MTTTSAFGLPSLQALDNATPLRIWLCTGKTDMRCGFDRLAAMSDPARAMHVLSRIRLLYDIEKQAKDCQPAERAAMRQTRSRPILAELHDWLLAQRDQVAGAQGVQGVLPKSPLGQAIQYALNHWQALVRYTDDGELAIDNNVAERAIRPLVIGRKNYLHLGSDTGGRTAATLYSVIASAKRQGMDPFIYLRDVLATIGSTPISQLDQFLPDVWKQKQLEEIATV